MSDVAKQYSWAVNVAKLERAVAAAGPKGTEKEIKALYISYAGLVREVGETPKKKRR